MKIAFDNTKPIGSDWSKDRVVNARAAELLSVTVQDKSGAGFYLQIFDSGTDKSGNENLIATQIVPAGGFVSVNFAHTINGTTFGREMKQGIYLAASTDPHQKTLLATNDAFFTCAFKV